MRTFVLLAIAAAAMAATGVGWGLAPGSLRNMAAVQKQAAEAVAPPVASATIEPAAPPPIAASRYRAEACSGDYVCRDGGPWEPVADRPAEAWMLTSDGF